MADDKAPVIVKRVIKGGEGHHGGAWKVAYADFVTAMMAFFLLMWLLNATTEKQRKGIADYFDPSIPLARISAGGQQMLAGDTVTSSQEKTGSAPPRPAAERKGGESPVAGDIRDGSAPERDEVPDDVRSDEPGQAQEPTGPEAAAQRVETSPDAGAAAFEAALRAEEARLEALGAEIEAAVSEAGETAGAHLIVRMTPEGLVIEITDTGAEPLFASGSALPSEYLAQLLEVITPVLTLAANPIAVVGHTDATPMLNPDYGNWELSVDRANAARRLFQAAGLDVERVARVSGRAATEPLADDPLAPENRRITVTLLRTVAR